MKRPMLVLVLASIVSTLAVGCMPNTMPAVAFEPRVYPYVPQLGPDATNK
jgi:hypothetical protein